jgi:hypothetical protein
MGSGNGSRVPIREAIKGPAGCWVDSGVAGISRSNRRDDDLDSKGVSFLAGLMGFCSWFSSGLHPSENARRRLLGGIQIKDRNSTRFSPPGAHNSL